jgi:DNA primase
MAIPDEDVARVRAAVDIVALISEHAALKRQGRRWVGLCPFHQEKTPSFSVNAEEGLYFCFGCQRSGDAISFVRDVEHVDFVEAVRRLADRTGVVIAEDAALSEQRKRRGPLLEAMEQAVAWYHERLLASSEAGPARDYLRSRGYDGEIVRRFRLGWAPDEWDALARELKLPDRVLVDSGLGFVNRLGRQQDAFRARVVFPIFDPSDRPIALGGRVLPPRPGSAPALGPKYKNSQDGPVYAKRRTLYGLNWAKHDVIASGEVIVCEGYTDVIAFFQAGLPRAVATCGTALGEEHFRLLGNFARRVVLAYDADVAGQAGASRVYEWERGHQVDVAVAALPPGSDPADLVRRDVDALRRAVAEAQPFLGFLVERVLRSADLRTAEGRAKAAESALAVVSEHPNELVRDQYVMLVADRCRLDPAALRALAAHPPRPRRDGPRTGPRVAANGSSSGPLGGGTAIGAALARDSGPETWRPGLEALRLAVHHPELVADRLEPVLFADPQQRAAFDALAGADSLHDAIALAEDQAPQAADLLRRLAVEDPSADADDVVVQLIRIAGRRALAELEAEARRSPGTFAVLASTISQVQRDLQDLDERDRSSEAADRLLAWLVDRCEETDE